MSGGSVMTILCSSVSDFRILKKEKKEVICAKGEKVGKVLGCFILHVPTKCYLVD